MKPMLLPFLVESPKNRFHKGVTKNRFHKGVTKNRTSISYRRFVIKAGLKLAQ